MTTMRRALLACFLMIPLLGFGQDAKIMILERSDTAALKTAYQDYKKAQEAWEQRKLEIAKKYTVEKGKVLDGWEKVDYSVDFRAVVPHKEYSMNSSLSLAPWRAVTTTASDNLLSVGIPFPSNALLAMTGVDGTVATLTPQNGELQVNVGVRPDIKTVERR